MGMIKVTPLDFRWLGSAIAHAPISKCSVTLINGTSVRPCGAYETPSRGESRPCPDT